MLAALPLLLRLLGHGNWFGFGFGFGFGFSVGLWALQPCSALLLNIAQAKEFQLQVFIQPPMRAFPAQARLLDAAKRDVLGGE